MSAFVEMKSFALWLPLLACLCLVGCHLDDLDGSKAGMLNTLNRVEAINVAHEKAGDPPPKGHRTWAAYWHSRFVAMQGVEDSGEFSHIGKENIAFIKRQRAATGLPPVN